MLRVASLISDKSKALSTLTESIRELYSLKITLPLGNPNLKLVHTNQFLFTELSNNEFNLANMAVISKALSGSDSSRLEGYQLNRWYIEGVTITNNGKDAKMELDLNPFASSLMKYKDNKRSYRKEYEDAQKKDEKSSKTNSSESTTGTGTLPGGEGKTIDNLVKKIVGTERNLLKMAKLIHNWLQKNNKYSYYMNSRTSTPTGAYNKMRKGGINCADLSRLTASMMRSAGITCYVVHSSCHYYTVVKINGKEYCSDATSKQRGFNTYWKASGCRGSTAKFRGSSSYGKKCGNNPCS